jgi:uncharacterized protein
LEFLIGFFVALSIGLTGVGGGTLTVPILILFLRVGAAEAVGTALVFSALVKLPACALYVSQKKVDLRALRYLLVGGVPGVLLGALLVRRLEGAGLRSVVLTFVGITICLTAAANLWRLWQDSDGGTAQTRDRARLLPWFAGPIGLEVGFSSAGAGALGTLLLLYMTPLTAAEVVGTDLVFGLALSTVGGVMHLGLGDWNPQLFWKLLAGGLPGALLGARLATMLPARALRMALLLWLVYLGSQLFYRGLQAIAG